MKNHLVSFRLLLVALVALCMTPVIGAAVYELQYEEHKAVADAKLNLARHADIRVAAISRMFVGIERVLQTAAHGMVPLLTQAGACRAYLADLNEHFSEFANLALTDSSGNVVCASASGQTGFSVSDRVYFQRALRTRMFSIGDFAIDRMTKRRSLMAALPVYEHDDLQGVLYALVELDSFLTRFSEIPSQSGMNDVLIDSAGIVLASTKPGLAIAGRPVTDQSLRHALQAAGSLQAADITDGAILYSMRPIKMDGGGGALVLASVTSLDSALSGAHDYLYLKLAALIVLTAAVSILAWKLGDHLVGHAIQRVLGRLRSIGEGHPEGSAPAGGGAWGIRELHHVERDLESLAKKLAIRAKQRDAAWLALAEGERRYRAQFEASPQPMWVYDQETLAFLLANDAAVVHYGYSRAEFMQMTLKDIRPPEDVPKLLKTLADNHCNPAGEAAARHRTKGGRILHVETAGHTIEWGTRKARMVVINDVTSRVEAAQAWEHLAETLATQVQVRTAELEDANKELEAFSYSVSHDLRAPVAAIQGFCFALAGRYGNLLPAQGAHYIDRISAGAKQMNALITALLSLSKVRREPLQLERIDVARLAADVVSRLREQFPQRQVTVDINPSLPAWGDARLVTVVLENLIGNAWKFTARTEHATIRIAAEPRSTAPSAIVVADNGAGFDAAHADKLFQPFRRLHSSAEFEGTGIGLATVHRIIRRLRGQVWAESETGQGARFYFALPQDPEASAPSLAVAST